MIDWRRWAGPGVVIVATAAGLAMLEVSGQAFWQGLAINLAIFSILTVSLNLTSGFTGVFSLGQIGFMAWARADGRLIDASNASLQYLQMHS